MRGPITLVVLAPILVIMLGLYGHYFKRMPWQVFPSQLTVCGRDYIYPDVQHPQSLAQADRYMHARVEPIGTTAGVIRTQWVWGIYDRSRAAAGTRCGTIVWVQTGNRLVAYSLSGGP